MTVPVKIATEKLADRVALPVSQAEAVLSLLEAGHSTSFIARYRRVATGGLDQQQVEQIDREATRLKTLEERRETIAKSIESHGKLTPELAAEIQQAESLARLEDLYLPYKPRKQNLADVARDRGLTPLAEEILADAPAVADLDARLPDFVSSDKELHSVADVLLGVGHLLAEWYSQRADIRDLVRQRLYERGRLVSRRVKPPTETDKSATAKPRKAKGKKQSAKPKAEGVPAEAASGEAASGEGVSSEAASAASVATDAVSPEAAANCGAATPDKTNETNEAVMPQSETAAAPLAEAAPPDDASVVDAPPEAASAESASAASGVVPTEPVADESESADTEADVAADAPSPASGNSEHDPQDEPQQGEPQDEPPSAEASSAPSPSDEGSTGTTQKRALSAQLPDPPDPPPLRRLPNDDDESGVVRAKEVAPPPDPAQVEAEQAEPTDAAPSDAVQPDSEPSEATRQEAPAPADSAADSVAPESAVDDPSATAETGSRPTGFEPSASEPAASEPAASEPGASEPGASVPPADASPADVAPVESEPVPGEPTPGEPAAAAGDVTAGETASGTSNEEPGASASSSKAPPAAGNVLALTPRTKATARKAVAKVAKQRRRERLERVFQEFFKHDEPIAGAAMHRVLGLLRGERVRVLRVTLEADTDALCDEASRLAVPEGHGHADFLRECLRDAVQRLILPSIEREIRRELNDRSEQYMLDVFARNARPLLLQQPLHRRIAAVTCDVRGAGRVAALDEAGQVLQHEMVRLLGPEGEVATGRARLAEVVQQHAIQVIAIGNGATCHRIEQLVADMLANELQGQGIEYSIVNEAGIGVYAASALGREELPELDGESRGAVSLGRRLLDPLMEFTKVPPTNLNAGRYQHEIKAKHLREALDAIVASCVNAVGVDLNRTSPATLRFVSGVNQLTARRIFERRLEKGPFRSREQLKETQGLTEAAFVEAAGFVRILDGENPLDATWIHPASYPLAGRVLEKMQITTEQLGTLLAGGDGAPQIRQQVLGRCAELDIADTAAELETTAREVRDLLDALRGIGHDPREQHLAPLLHERLLRFEDLQPDLELQGTVLNVVPFGAFVDIGLSDSALLHISRLSDQYVQDPHDVVATGDVLRVWVHSVDGNKRRVSLTAIDPRSRRRESGRPPRLNSGSPRPDSGPGGQGQTRRERPPRKQARSGRPGRGSHEQKPKPKPVKPITKAMADGKEPMRSFSDLLQFFDKKPDSPPDSGDAKHD